MGGARRQPPCVDIRYLEQTVYDRWDSLRSLGLVPSDAQPPANVVSFDLLAAELERAGLEGPESPPPQEHCNKGEDCYDEEGRTHS